MTETYKIIRNYVFLERFVTTQNRSIKKWAFWAFCSCLRNNEPSRRIRYHIAIHYLATHRLHLSFMTIQQVSIKVRFKICSITAKLTKVAFFLCMTDHITVFDFQRKTTYARGAICVIDIYIFWLLGVQGVQKCKPRQATPPGGGVSLGVVWEKFWDIQNVAWGHNSISFKFQPSRSNTTPGAVWRRCKITPNTPLSTMRAGEWGEFLSSSPVGKLGELPRLWNVEKS